MIKQSSKERFDFLRWVVFAELLTFINMMGWELCVMVRKQIPQAGQPLLCFLK